MNQPASSSSNVRYRKLRFTTAAKLFLVAMGIGFIVTFTALILVLSET